MTDLNVQESEAEEQTEESAGEGEKEPSEERTGGDDWKETDGGRSASDPGNRLQNLVSGDAESAANDCANHQTAAIRDQFRGGTAVGDSRTGKRLAAGGQQGSEAETSGGAGNSLARRKVQALRKRPVRQERPAPQGHPARLAGRKPRQKGRGQIQRMAREEKAMTETAETLPEEDRTGILPEKR